MSQDTSSATTDGIPLDEPIPVLREPDGDGPHSLTDRPRNLDRITEIVDTVAEADGELTVGLRNIGGMPWFRPTPYRNNDGVVVRMWSCISVYPKAVPGHTMLFGRRSPIWPDERDGYNVNIFTREWVWAQLSKGTHVVVLRAEDSPFCTDWYDWHWSEREKTA